MKENNLQQKDPIQKCGESCGCSEKPTQKISSEKPTEETKLNPTRFGDWEINGRAIDF